MPRFNEFYYLNGYYGVRAALAYSAEPIVATAVNYDSVRVEWLAPTGTYSDFRLVRSQIGLPQTQEDGAIIYSSVGAPTDTKMLDSTANSSAPLIPGRFVFYRAWVRKAESSYWVPAGDAYTLLPSPNSLGVGRDAVYSGAAPDGFNTDDVLISSNPNINPTVSTTHDRFMEMLPRVLISNTSSGTDVIYAQYDPYGEPSGKKDNSLISEFLSAFSFSLDEFLTFASLIVPDTNIHYANPTSVFLGSHDLGLTLDVEPVTSTQRRLLRNAIKIYQNKGTRPGLELLVQSMTGYDASVSDTNNLLLTIADATFNFINWEEGQPVGNWTTTSPDITITPYTEGLVLDQVQVPRTLDPTYCLLVSSTTAGEGILLGTKDPVNTAIPVTAGLRYTASMYFKESEVHEGDPDVIGSEFIWYDRFGQKISSDEDFFYNDLDSPLAEGTTWARYRTPSHVAPVGAVYAGVGVYFSATYPVYIDMVQFEQSFKSTEYQEPRGVIVTLNPPKRNFIKNSSFTSGVHFWSSTGADPVVTSEDFRSGGSSLKAVLDTSERRVSYDDYIPITPGLYYTVSAYVKDVSAFKDWKIGITFQNSGVGSTFEIYDGEYKTVNRSDWTRLVFSVKAPEGFTTATVQLTASANEVDGGYALIDAVQFEQSNAATDYFDGYLVDDGGEFEAGPARKYSWTGTPHLSTSIAEIDNAGTAGETRTNLIINPSFEVNTTGWSTQDCTASVVSSGSYSGLSAVEIVADASGYIYTTDRIKLEANKVYIASVWVKGPAGSQINLSVQQWNAQTGGSTTGGGYNWVDTDGTWQRISMTVMANGDPDNWAEIRVGNENSTPYTFLADDVLLEQTSILRPYFDGSTLNGREYAAIPGSVYSVNYPSKSVRLQRLQNEIQEYLGFDTPYYIETAEGAYTKGIS